jgi:VCBS repeat-containing protein
VDPPNHGILTLDTAGNYTYTPDANFNGTDTLSYALCDVDGDCDTATLVITVTPVDDFPVAVNDTTSTLEDTPVSGSVRGNDTLSGDGGNLISVVDPPNHGILTLDTAGNYTYTPDANFNGADTLTYALCDVDGDCDTATLVITVTPVDDFPVAVSDRDTTNEDTPLTGMYASTIRPVAMEATGPRWQQLRPMVRSPWIASATIPTFRILTSTAPTLLATSSVMWTATAIQRLS